MRNTSLLLFLLLLSFSLKAQHVFNEIDINPGANSSLPEQMAEYNGKMYFFANNGTNGMELWVSDGTVAGSSMLKDINPGATGSFPSYGSEQYYGMVVYNSKLYFGASDGTNGAELWVTDGTATGTQMVKDINPGAGSSTPSNLAICNGKIYMQATDGTNGFELWVSDGTAAGTQMVKDINAGAVNGSPRHILAYNSKVIFWAKTATDGVEPWITDGTAGGTQMIKDLNTGIGDGCGDLSKPFVLLNGKLYFNGRDQTLGSELWVTDGTATGTQMIKDISNVGGGSDPRGLIVYSGKIYFSAKTTISGTNDPELWVSDGTTGGTQLLKDIQPGDVGSFPSEFIVYSGKLYFSASNGGTNGTEIWVTDGTATGTVILKDLFPGAGGGMPIRMTLYAGKLYFIAQKAFGNETLWSTDGTAAGTIMIAPASQTATSQVFSSGVALSVANNTLFIAQARYKDVASGSELWTVKDTTYIPPTTSIANTKGSLFTVSPNPAKDKFTVSMNGNYLDANISVTDMMGKEIIKQPLIEKSATIDMKGMPKGTYIVILKHNSGTGMQKLILE